MTGRASEGERSVRLFADNLTDAVKVWIERPFEATPGATYRVSVSFDVGTDAFEIGAWEVIGAASASDPTAAFAAGGVDGIGDFLRLGPAATPDGEFVFLPRSFSQTVRAGPEGELWVGAGVWGTFETAAEYFLDSVTVEIQREG
ncbi:MAG: hypothetical protein ABR599_10735 [Gemmatimonadota bacterium]